MFDRVLDKPLSNNLLWLTEGLKRRFPPLGLGKGILHSPYLLIPLINIKSKKVKPWTPIASWFPWVTPETKRQNIWSSFTYSFFCARSFDQELWSSLIYLFDLHTTIRPAYIVLFHLFFLLHTTIRPKYIALFHLFLFCAQPFIQNIWSSFIYSFFSGLPFD